MPFTEIVSSASKSRVAKINFCDILKTPLNDFTFKKMVDSTIHGIMKAIAFNIKSGGTDLLKYSSCGSKQCSSDTYTNLKNKFNDYYSTS